MKSLRITPLFKKVKTEKVIIPLIVLLAMMIFMPAKWVQAITIIVDGVREAAWSGGGSATDPDEAGITNNGVDLETIEWTNSTTDFYWLFNTYITTNWNRIGPDPFVVLCIDNDNSDATGTSLFVPCPGAGYDRYITVEGPTPLTVTVFDDDFTTVIPATVSVATATDITELSVDVTSLGLSSANCGTMPVTVYMDDSTAKRVANPPQNGESLIQ